VKSHPFLFLIIVMMLVSCTPAPDHAELEPGCDAPGEIMGSKIENVSRGYSYQYVIYLPPCYAAAADPGYPVIYLVPGLGSGANAWFSVGVNDTADQLILSGEVPPFIIVGTEATGNDPSGTDIIKDLIPHIETNYNALEGRSYQAIAGASLGGSAAYRLTFQHPDEFASAGMFGSGMIIGEDEQVATWLASTPKANRPRVFFNSGEQDPLMVERAQAMIEILEDANVHYEFVIGEGDHSYVYWASNMEQYFRWVAEAW
jgi:enterochelin esterase-like enzyme